MAQSNFEIDKTKLLSLAKKNGIKLELNINWIGPDMERAWKNHQKQYPDLHKDLTKLFDDVNRWVKKM